MSNNPGDAATPAREQQPEQTQTPDIIQDAQGAQPATSQPTTDANNQAQTAQPNQGSAPTGSAWSTPTPAQTAASAMPQPTGDQTEGVADSADITGGTDPHADDNARMQTQAKPDVSDQDWRELVPKLMAEFNNNREQLAHAIGLHRSTVDRWLNGKSRPNTSTILRMRRLMQERRIE